MKAVGLGSYSITIARDNTGQPAAYVNNSQEASASGEEAILASFLQDARDAGAEDALYAAIATSQAAVALGKLGGKAKSTAKTATARENGRKGGRPILVSVRNAVSGLWSVRKVSAAVRDQLMQHNIARTPTLAERETWHAASKAK